MGKLLTYLLTVGGSFLAIFYPFIGLLVYVCFAILRRNLFGSGNFQCWRRLQPIRCHRLAHRLGVSIVRDLAVRQGGSYRCLHRLLFLVGCGSVAHVHEYARSQGVCD